MDEKIRSSQVSNWLLILNILVSFIYLGWWFDFSHIHNPVLYSLLLFGEIYHVTMACGFWFTVWNRKKKNKTPSTQKAYHPLIDVFITVAGEPVEIVKETIQAAKKIDYPDFQIYVLNDGYVAKKENWKDIDNLAENLGVNCITRKTPGGNKAGNINNALSETTHEFVAILDADMVPHKDFLKKLTPFFNDPEIAFVQSPQYYKNHEKNEITKGAWEQQSFFFGPIMNQKNKVNAAFICGTNVLIRRAALNEVGGIDEKNIAEDFLTSLFIHKKGWKSHYVSEVLCEGLAPEDLLSYYKQQHRWARGSLGVFFTHNPLFSRKLSFSARIQYLLSSIFYLNGVVVLIDITMPLLFLFFSMQPVNTSTSSFALFFIPYILLNLYTIYIVSGESITFRAISFTQSSWTLQLAALFSILTGKKTAFAVTSKKQQQGNFIYLSYPHIFYCVLSIIGLLINIPKYTDPAVFANSAWTVFNMVMFLPFILASFQTSPKPTIHYMPIRKLEHI